MGALVRDGQNRVFVHRRTPDRRLLPGTWDIPGGHVEPGETLEAALAREIEEETGWTLRRIESVVADWEWTYDGVTRRERDYLVYVDGDLAAPRLEVGKQDRFDWVGRDNVELMMVGRTDGDRRLRDLVAKAARTRLTERLRLEPIGSEDADELWALHQDPDVAAWYAGSWTVEYAMRRARGCAEAWENRGVDKWLAYERSSGAPIGRGGLSYQFVAGAQRLEVGWAVRSERQGHGFATEIGRQALDFAFGDLHADEVVAFTETGNHRSRAVMERLGMRFVREFEHDDGVPCVLYAASAR